MNTEETGSPHASEPDADDEAQERSTVKFPYMDLDAAIEVADTAWAQFGSGGCKVEDLAPYMDSTATSSAFRTKLATARTFGLIQNARGVVKLTPLGQRIVQGETRDAAKVEAFMAVPLYRELNDAYAGKILPGDTGLESDMRTQWAVPAKSAHRARQVFQRSAEQAGFFKLGRNRLVRPNIGTSETPPPAHDGHGDDGGGNGASGAGGEPPAGGNGGREDTVTLPAMSDPLLAGILAKLPAPDEAFPESEQEQWLSLAAMAMKMVYKSAAPAPHANGQPTRLNAVEPPTGTGASAGAATGEAAG